MISIKSKYDCCGCEACAQRCAHNAISMVQDEEGFLYPKIDKQICTDCGLCEKVCPIINQNEIKTPFATYAAKNNNELIRLNSSSGGIFTLLATKIIDDGGVVFGAKFDEQWNVVHDYAETIEELAKFRGSKYVQSQIGSSYKIAEIFLKNGRDVLFSGTPCQIAGLKRYLIKEYKNLICVDIICHGVPSPMVWQRYIDEFKNRTKISHISMRDKTNGWKKFGLIINSVNKCICNETLSKNIFLKVFLKNLSLRPSCYNCSSLSGKSNSDITIADFWGIQNIHSEFDDDKGVNLVIINSSKGLELFNSLDNCEKIETDFEKAISYNPSYFKSVAEPKYRKYFFDNFDKYGFEVYQKILKKQHPSLIRRIASRCKRIILK